MLRYGLGLAQRGIGKFFGLFGSKAEQVGAAAADVGAASTARTALGLKSLRASGGLTDDALEKGLSIVANETAAAAKSAAKGSWWTKPLMFLGLGGAADWLINGKQGLVGGAMNSTWTQLGQIEAEQNVVGKWHGIYKTIQEILDMFRIKDTFLNEWVEERLNSTRDKTSTYDRLTESEGLDTLKVAAEAVVPNVIDQGNQNIAALTVATPVVGYAGYKAMNYAMTAASASPVVETIEGNKGIFAKATDWLLHTKLGRIVGIGAVATAATAATIGYARAEETNDGSEPITTSSVTPPGQELGLIDQGVNFAKGLWSEATNTSEWSVGGALNLANAGAHGLVDGAGYLGSFAYANTVGWFTGQSTDEVHEQYVGAAIDSAFENTVGMPDLSGHWAQAVHTVGEFGMPAKAAGMAGARLITAFNLAEKVGFGATVTRGSIHLGTQMAAPTPTAF